ncbi:hypothetical protein [Mycobacterium sp. OAE908]|uniref:DUF7065 domain-containing protein n=1 Tax=Mycobacterium sp. OAE908 TaxID=2817899 RepID=UPI001AE61773
MDESLFHQDGRSMAMAAHSDHRFYDRYWIGVYDPAGGRALITGMGVYKNNNAIDAFVAVQQNDIQYNVRLARPLHPQWEQRIGPLRHDIDEGLKQLHLVLEPGEYPISCDLVWTGTTPPFEEKRHYSTASTRIVQDYMRYDQAGVVNGTMTIDGETIEVDNWRGARDHAWGVRPGVGGFEPNAGPDNNMGARGFLYQWCCWGNDRIAGYVQIHQDGEGRRLHNDGLIRYVGRDDEPPLELVHGEVSVEFVPGTRVYSKAGIEFTTHDGSQWNLEVRPLCTAWAMNGTGYTGYNDLKGHGWHRPLTVEWDTYDISNLRYATLLPSGERVPSFHREQPCFTSLNGDEGIGHFTIIPMAPLPKYGFMDDLESWTADE